MRWFFLRTQKWSVIKEKGETMIRLHNLRVETFNPTFVSTHHIRKRVRMKLSWASTRDRVVWQLGESRKKSWRIFERAREREKQCSASIERIHVRKVCSKLRDKRPPSPREYPLFHPCEEARTTFNPFPEFRRPLATHLSRIFRTFFPP